MKATRFRSRVSMASSTITPIRPKKILFASLLAAGAASLPAHAVIISISGTNQTFDQPIIDFISTNFTNVTSITYGDYSNPANIPAGTEVFMVGRRLSSTAYANAANSTTFNGLEIPVVAFTSYVTRPDGGRWGWESGPRVGGFDPSGNETVVTVAGAAVLGISAGDHDFFSVVGSGDALGTGTVGTGSILATINGNILAAGWTEGQQSAGGDTFGGNRLLWNAFQVTNENSPTVLPDTFDGQQALVNAISFYTGLTPVPEPSAAFLGGLGALALLRRRRA